MPNHFAPIPLHELMQLGALTSKIGHNTRAVQVARHVVAIVLHDSPIILAHAAGAYAVWSWGWNSPTTANRVNGLSPCSMYRQNWDWFIDGERFQRPHMVARESDGSYTNVPMPQWVDAERKINFRGQQYQVSSLVRWLNETVQERDMVCPPVPARDSDGLTVHDVLNMTSGLLRSLPSEFTQSALTGTKYLPRVWRHGSNLSIIRRVWDSEGSVYGVSTLPDDSDTFLPTPRIYDTLKAAKGSIGQ